MKKLFGYSLFLGVVALFGAGVVSCSDDKDEPKPQETEITDMLQRDMARGSISQREFNDKVVGRLWLPSNNEPIDMAGNVLGTDYMLLGGPAYDGYYFGKNEYEFFWQPRYLTNPLGDYLRSKYEYSYDAQTGMVYTSKDGYKYEGVDKNVLFYIESLTDDTMIIRTQYYNSSLLPLAEGDNYNMAYRWKLTALDDSKVQSWFDKYVSVE